MEVGVRPAPSFSLLITRSALLLCPTTKSRKPVPLLLRCPPPSPSPWSVSTRSRFLFKWLRELTPKSSMNQFESRVWCRFSFPEKKDTGGLEFLGTALEIFETVSFDADALACATGHLFLVRGHLVFWRPAKGGFFPQTETTVGFFD